MSLLLLLACQPPSSTPPDPEIPIAPYDAAAYVDPFIGTGGIGAQIASVSPGASRPFGMTLVGPDTAASYGALGAYHCAGYHWPDTFIRGFSHTHAHGMGVTDYGAIQYMPADGWSDALMSQTGRQLTFDHEREWAEPGWYAVELDEGRMRVDIAATERGATHRITFEPDAEPVLVFDLAFALQGDHVEAGRVDIDLDAGTLSGMQNLHGSYSGRFGGLMTHFAGRLSPAPVASGTWNDGVATPDSTAVDGAEVGFWLEFPPGTTEVSLDLAVSYVDVEGAENNLATELPAFDLESVREQAYSAWQDELEGVRIEADDTERRMFHTAQYHAMLMPSLNQDVDGRYRGMDQEIHEIDHDYYSDFSLWDTFRTQHPWLLLTRPNRQRDMVRSLLQMTEDGGSLPRWPMAHGYTGGMVGTPAVQVLAGSAMKDLGGFDEGRALDISVRAAMENQEHAGRSGHDSYRELGFVSFEDSGTPASRTLEYAWSDHALAEWAAREGHPSADTLAEQSRNWRNTFDVDQGWFVGRHEDGSFDPVDNAFFWADSYTEGNAWHYRWGVFLDPDGLLEHTHNGSADDGLNAMATYWEAVRDEPDDDLPDDYYWHGNEPDLHYAMLPALWGDTEMTNEAVRLLQDTRYNATEEGLDGNDDAGTLSSWFLFTSLGLYPMAGTDGYVVMRPRYSRAELDLDGRTLVIDGQLDGPIIDHSTLMGHAE